MKKRLGWIWLVKYQFIKTNPDNHSFTKNDYIIKNLYHLKIVEWPTSINKYKKVINKAHGSWPLK